MVFLVQLHHLLLMAPYGTKQRQCAECFTLAYKDVFSPGNVIEEHCEREKFKTEQIIFKPGFLFLTVWSSKSLFTMSS